MNIRVLFHYLVGFDGYTFVETSSASYALIIILGDTHVCWNEVDKRRNALEIKINVSTGTILRPLHNNYFEKKYWKHWISTGFLLHQWRKWTKTEGESSLRYFKNTFHPHLLGLLLSLGRKQFSTNQFLQVILISWSKNQSDLFPRRYYPGKTTDISKNLKNKNITAGGCVPLLLLRLSSVLNLVLEKLLNLLVQVVSCYLL